MTSTTHHNPICIPSGIVAMLMAHPSAWRHRIALFVGVALALVPIPVPYPNVPGIVLVAFALRGLPAAARLEQSATIDNQARGMHAAR